MRKEFATPTIIIKKICLFNSFIILYTISSQSILFKRVQERPHHFILIACQVKFPPPLKQCSQLILPPKLHSAHKIFLFLAFQIPKFYAKAMEPSIAVVFWPPFPSILSHSSLLLCSWTTNISTILLCKSRRLVGYSKCLHFASATGIWHIRSVKFRWTKIFV